MVGVLLVREINSYLRRNFPSSDDPPEYTSESVWDTLKEDNDTSRGLHTNAIPFLIEHLRYKPSRFSKALDSVRMNHQSIGEWLDHLPSAAATDEYRNRAVAYIASIGPPAKSAIPTLLHIISDPEESADLRGSCAYALSQLSNCLPVFTVEITKMASGGDALAKQYAAELLALIGPEAKSAVPVLVAQTTNASIACSAAAAYALWMIDRQTNTAITVLTNALRLQSVNDQFNTLRRLRQLGTAGGPAAAAVVPLLEHAKVSVRSEAERCLAEINPAMLDKAVADLNAKEPEYIERLMRELEMDTKPSYLSVANLLKLHSSKLVPMVPRLATVLQSTTGPRFYITQKFDAASVLAEIGPDAEAAVPALLSAATNYTNWSVAPYFYALGRIGPGASNAVPLLERVIDEGQEFTEMFFASEALAKISPGNLKGAKFLKNAAQSGSRAAPAGGAPMSASAIQEIRRKYGLPTPGGAAVSATSSIGFDYSTHEYVVLWKAKQVKESPLPALMKCVEQNGAWREDAIERLGDLGPEAKPALPLLEKWLSLTNSRGERLSAALAMKRIDPDEFHRLKLPGTLGVP